MTDQPTDLTTILRLSLQVCGCGDVKGVHANEGTGECRNPRCDCTAYRQRVQLVKTEAA